MPSAPWTRCPALGRFLDSRFHVSGCRATSPREILDSVFGSKAPVRQALPLISNCGPIDGSMVYVILTDPCSRLRSIISRSLVLSVFCRSWLCKACLVMPIPASGPPTSASLPGSFSICSRTCKARHWVLWEVVLVLFADDCFNAIDPSAQPFKGFDASLCISGFLG